MASLELIHYVPHRPHVEEDGQVVWRRDVACRPIENLPQLYWADGSPWLEANLWAHDRGTSGKTELTTVQSDLRHLHKYADWLEDEELDWRHFPMLERDRALIRWRKHLVEMRDRYGLLAPSTATYRMNATIRFYRYARAYSLIARDHPLWQERQTVLQYHDSHGFERTMLVSGTDISIPNRVRHGLRLEDGLTPLTREQMREILNFAAQEVNSSLELFMMLQIGFFSGARIETITDLKKGTLDHAVEDPSVPGVVYLAVGPGNKPHVATKFNVTGRIMMPLWLFEDLRQYAGSTIRLKREIVATCENKDLIFLTRYGNRYVNGESNQGTAVGRAMVDFRREAFNAGLKFAKNFHFHMTRATFGTWVTSMLLDKGYSVKAVLTFVRDAMLHKDEATTLRYIKFVEQNPIKIEVANEFTHAFLGLNIRRKANRA